MARATCLHQQLESESSCIIYVAFFLTWNSDASDWQAVSLHFSEGDFNVEMRIGGDSGLSRRGEEFARRTAEFVSWPHAASWVDCALPPVDGIASPKPCPIQVHAHMHED